MYIIGVLVCLKVFYKNAKTNVHFKMATGILKFPERKVKMSMVVFLSGDV